MKNIIFCIAFIPVGISIICSALITTNEAVSVFPIWPIWGVLIISTLVAFFTIASVLTVGLVQWLKQFMNKQTT